MAATNNTPIKAGDRNYIGFSLDDSAPSNPMMYWNGRFIDLVKTSPEYWPDIARDRAELIATVERWKQARACGAHMVEAHGFASGGAGMSYPEWHENEERNTREAIRRYRMAREVAA